MRAASRDRSCSTIGTVSVGALHQSEFHAWSGVTQRQAVIRSGRTRPPVTESRGPSRWRGPRQPICGGGPVVRQAHDGATMVAKARRPPPFEIVRYGSACLLACGNGRQRTAPDPSQPPWQCGGTHWYRGRCLQTNAGADGHGHTSPKMVLYVSPIPWSAIAGTSQFGRLPVTPAEATGVEEERPHCHCTASYVACSKSRRGLD
jgi:hypothetical protein